MRTILQDAAGAPTKAVYQYDETLRKHLTRVTSIRALSDLSEAEQELFKQAEPDVCVLETTDTIFYAQSGGQPFDLGYMVLNDSGQKETRFEVEAVRYGAEGRILHFGRFHEGTSAPGDMVEQHIDGARRDLNSRCHTAGHILGLAFNGVIDSKYKDAIQAKSSQYVKDALPIKLYWYKPDQLQEKGVLHPEGKPIVSGHDGNVRVVEIETAGAYPCGGTHVPDTSVVGEIVVKGIKRQKGISKVSYSIHGKT